MWWLQRLGAFLGLCHGTFLSYIYNYTYLLCLAHSHIYSWELPCRWVFTYICTHFISVYEGRTIKLCPKEHLHKNAFLNFSGQTNNLIARFLIFQFSFRRDWAHVSLCRDWVTEVAALAPYSDVSMAFFFLYKSDFCKRPAEQERFSYAEVMFYTNIFLG